MVTDEEGSRIIPPDVLAASLGVDVAREGQAAIDTRIEEAFRRYGPLANLRNGAEDGGSFVGAINEHTLADIMLYPLGGRLIHDRASGRFYLFDDSTGVFKQITREELWCTLARHYAGLPLLSPKLAPLGARPGSVRMMKGAADALAALTGENYPFGGDPDELETVIRKPVANGLLVFDLQAGDAMPSFRPGFAATDRALHRAPVAYVPAACRQPTRLIEELLIPSLGGEDEAEAFLDDLAAAWAGGALWPHLLALIGAANSGKSTVVEMLRALHGRPHWVALSPRSVGDKFGASFLAGPVRIVSFTDAKGEALTGEVGELIKSLTGGDFREDRGPHAQLLTGIKGDKVFILTSNSVPHIDLQSDVEAWLRRVRPWRFQSYEPAKRIPDFGKVLLEHEGAALLNRLVDGVRRRIRLRDEGRRPEMLPSQSALMDEILRRSCPVASFLESRVIADRGSQINRAEAYSLFSDWLRAERRNSPQWARDEFYRRAAEVMKRAFGASLSHSIDGGVKGWRSCRWKSQIEQENDD